MRCNLSSILVSYSCLYINSCDSPSPKTCVGLLLLSTRQKITHTRMQQLAGPTGVSRAHVSHKLRQCAASERARGGIKLASQNSNLSCTIF